MSSASKLQLFYDGRCIVCSREIEHYLKVDQGRALAAVDISAPGFDASRYGLESARVRKYFHVLTAEGQVKVGVEAFAEIWDRLPGGLFRSLGRFARVRPTRALMEASYRVFVEVRPYLPKKKNECDNGVCRVA